ncbi:MAG: TIGR00268 family protein, partial [Thaumarchaeota archaeon]|nr:TIGR00268 family protein [Nitrososphaerota archaeon]
PLVDTDFTKKMVRNVARYVGLSVHDRPSNSCLASRIPWGQRVTSERLVRIELGENLVRQLTGIRQVRVRDISGAARIEVETQHIPLLCDGLDEITTKLKAFGFSSVSIDQSGYRPGKINVVGD